MSQCVVCLAPMRRPCGPLNGQAKSWRCAGLLAASVAKAREARRRMDSPEKRAIREMVGRIAEDHAYPRILDLWGGGASAEMFASDSSAVTSAEHNQSLWPALRAGASEHGYQAHCGPLTSLERPRGGFGFAWLDLCGQASKAASEAIAHVARNLMNGDWIGDVRLNRSHTTIAVTLMPEREADEFLASSRAISIPMWLVGLTDMGPALMQTYKRPTGHSMMLVVLTKALAGDYGRGGWDPYVASRAMSRDGRWAAAGWEGYFTGRGHPELAGTKGHWIGGTIDGHF